MKSVKYLTEDEKVRTAFYHLKDGIRLEEGDYLIFRDYGKVKIPWHRIVEIKEFQRWKAYANNYLEETNPVEDGENRPEMYHEAIEIIEKLPEFFPPTERMPWSKLEEKIEDESEHIEDETTVESIISLSEYFGMLEWTDEGLSTVNLVSEDPELPSR